MARRTLGEIEASRPDFDRAVLDATTEEDIRRHMIEDGRHPDADLPDTWELVVPPRLVRKRLGMTQGEFAAALHVPIATLQDWEKRGVLEPAVRSLLAIIYRMPEALQALDPKRAADPAYSAATSVSRRRGWSRRAQAGRSKRNFP